MEPAVINRLQERYRDALEAICGDGLDDEKTTIGWVDSEFVWFWRWSFGCAARKRCGKRAIVQHVTGHRGLPLSEPIRTITTKDQWAIIDGRWYRPLTVRENARAMGFPDSYSWPESNRRDAIKGLGNAVPPPVAREIVSQAMAA